MKKIKSALVVLKKEGVAPFIKKSFLFFFFPAYELVFYWKIIKNLHNFKDADPRQAFDFISKKFFGIFAPMQVAGEFINLLELFAKQKPAVILEIGTARGGTLFCFAKLAKPDALIVSIDLPEGKFGGGYGKIREKLYRAFALPGQQLHLLREDSHASETLEKVRKVLAGRQVDFLFIDGDHTYGGVKKDFEMYSQLVKRGGAITFHDVAVHTPESGCLVHLFWEEIKKERLYVEFIQNRDQKWAGIGVLKNWIH